MTLSIPDGSSMMFGTPEVTAASCLRLVTTTVTVDADSGLLVTASIARTTFAADGSVRAVCVSTFTLVVPVSTGTRLNAGQA